MVIVDCQCICDVFGPILVRQRSEARAVVRLEGLEDNANWISYIAIRRVAIFIAIFAGVQMYSQQSNIFFFFLSSGVYLKLGWSAASDFVPIIALGLSSNDEYMKSDLSAANDFVVLVALGLSNSREYYLR